MTQTQRMPSRDTSAPWLQHTGGREDIPAKTVLESLPFVIGRVEAVDLQINSTRVSREHAAIEQGEQGYRIRDLGSTNGTFVNGERIQQAELTDGDLVMIADCEFTFGCQSGAETQRYCATQIMDEIKRTQPSKGENQILAVRRFQQRLLHGGAAPSLEEILDTESGQTVGFWSELEPTVCGPDEPSWPGLRAPGSCHLVARHWQLQRMRAAELFNQRACEGWLLLETSAEEAELPSLRSQLAWLSDHVGPDRLIVGLPVSALRDGERAAALCRHLDRVGIRLAYTAFVGGRTQVMQLADHPPELLLLAPSLASSLRARSAQCRQLSALAQACREIGCQPVVTGARSQDDVDACHELGLNLVVWHDGDRMHHDLVSSSSHSR